MKKIRYDDEIEYTLAQLQPKMFQAFDRINEFIDDIDTTKDAYDEPIEYENEWKSSSVPEPVEQEHWFLDKLAKVLGVVAAVKPELAVALPVIKLIQGIGKKRKKKGAVLDTILDEETIAVLFKLYEKKQDKKAKKKAERKSRKASSKKEEEVLIDKSQPDDVLSSVTWHSRYKSKFHVGKADIVSAPVNITIIGYDAGKRVTFSRDDGHNMSGGVAGKGASYHTFAIERRDDGTFFSDIQNHSSHGISTGLFKELGSRKPYAIVVAWTVGGKVQGRSEVYNVGKF